MADGEIGFIGIGNMGSAMVRCLARAGFRLHLYDQRANVLLPFSEPGGPFVIARALADLAGAADVVITMLPDSKAVRAVALGSDDGGGLAAQLRPGSIIVDMSSSFPLATVALGEELEFRGIRLVDAPVSGGVPRAASGTLAIMAGGAEEDLARVEPVLKAMGSVHRTGKLGSGHAMKALNNYVSAAGLIATCEALVIGQRFGLDGATMTRVLNASTGRNNTTENKVERYILNRAFNSGFALALLNKDVGMARALAEELGVAADGLDYVASQLAHALKALGADADHTAVYEYIEGPGEGA
jgi:3-hydroxyisobutyrate dehydrogenase